MYQLQHVYYNYGKHSVLKDVTFTIPRGKVIALAGENGSGKSTLLRLLTGITTPTKGKVLFDGMTVTNEVSHFVSYMPDTDYYFPHKTGDQLIEYFDAIFEDFTTTRAYEIAEYLEVNCGERIKDLSKGQRGRLKMVMILARLTDFYVLDEPFAGLDPIVREHLIKGLIKFTDMSSQTIILSTHEIREVEPIVDALLLLKEGQVISYEAIDAIREEWKQDAVSWMKTQYRGNER